MKKTIKIALPILLTLVAIVGVTLFFQNYDVAVLNPQGEIATKQRDLIVFTLLLSAVVVIPVFIMLGLFAWKYRESNRKAKYRPNWDSNKWLEVIWWGIPCVIILVLGIITWRTSHELDPYKKLDSAVKPLEVQVVALQWKWLFIYPEQGIASINFLQIPEKTPINFTLTSDAPMNAFWIPSLGSQVYAMSGMSSKLHLIADKPGDYRGSSTNISGDGFADMVFTARALSRKDFDTWAQTVKHTPSGLDMALYDTLAQKGTMKEPTYYRLEDNELYDKIVTKYMAPNSSKTDEDSQEDPAPMHHDMHHSDMPGMEGM